MASVDTKTKLQWFQFPSGVVFDGKIFGTSNVCSLFKAKDAITAPLSSNVDLDGLGLNNVHSMPLAHKVSPVSEQTPEVVIPILGRLLVEYLRRPMGLESISPETSPMSPKSLKCTRMRRSGWQPLNENGRCSLARFRMKRAAN